MTMNNILKTIICGAVVIVASTSCQKFFTREPINEFSAETYFGSEAELKMYTDGMLNSWLPDYTETTGGDAYNDLIATKTSTDYFRADVIWDGSKQGSWSYSFARRIAFMLEGMEKNAKGKVSDEAYKHYEGLARFWRAYTYMARVKTWSNVPWIDKYLDIKDPEVTKDRDDREFVFHKITEDLLFACENVREVAGTDGTKRNQIDKYVVNAIAARFFLYEGTYRLNHEVNHATGQPWNNQYEKPQELLEMAAKCAKTVIDSKKFSLHANYSELFLSPVLCADEVIWGQVFIGAINGRHALTRYFNSSTMGQQYSGTKPLMMHFLKADGSSVANEYIDINNEFAGRDSRLAATVLGPGRKVANLNAQEVDAAINCTFCKTGYMLVKWCVPDETHYQNGVDENSLPILRYAEVLLMYAEAMNELGRFDKTIWDMTVGALRQRAGVTSIYPTKADKWLEEYYCSNLSHTDITKGDKAVALEIRRERVTELTFEAGLRQDDLYRYAQCDLIERRYNHQGWAGLWVTADQAKNGFKFAGNTYTFGNDKTKNSETNYPISDTNNLNWTLEPAGNGYLLVYNYKLKWDDSKMYVRPLADSDKTIMENWGGKLTESYGW